MSCMKDLAVQFEGCDDHEGSVQQLKAACKTVSSYVNADAFHGLFSSDLTHKQEVSTALSPLTAL